MKKTFLLMLTALMLFSCEKEEFVNELPSVKVTEDVPAEVQYPQGFYVLNEDWFGHDNGTLNHFRKNGDVYDIDYRVYRQANPGEMLGVTSCYGTFWGENLYVVSKDERHLVVADARTLEKKMEYKNEERGVQAYYFVGIDDKTAYIGFDHGLNVYDINSMQVGEKVEGIDGLVGNLVYSYGKVFALAPDRLYVVNTKTHQVEKTFEGSYLQMTTDRNGNIFVAADEKLIKLDAKTLARTEFAYPDNAKPSDVWGAWNPGSMCFSMKSNTIYWAGGGSMFGGARKVFKMNLDTNEIKEIFALGKSDRGNNMELYGAGLRVDPLTDELILQTKHTGFGDSFLYNYIYKLDADGKEITHFEVLDPDGEPYYWMPSLPVFEDMNQPQILINKVEIDHKTGVDIDLQKVIVDYDNIFSTMTVTAEVDEENVAEVTVHDGVLTILAGKMKGTAQCTLTVISNGVKVSKTIEIENK